MREIKFRQWLGNRFEYWGVGVGACAFVSPASGSGINALTTPHQQFTGLKDKNGVEIYEGDILSTVTGFRGVMGWREDIGAWSQFLPMDYFEVVGNIYEHEELIK